MIKSPRYYQVDATDASRRSFARGSKGVLVVMATGTGKTVLFVDWAKMALTKGGRVLILVDRDVLVQQSIEELYEFGMFPVAECGEQHASPMSNLVVSSVQSMSKRLAKWNQSHFSLVVTDEAHKSASSTFRATLNHFKSAYHAGVTATPNRPDKRGLWQGYEEIVYEFPLKTRFNKDGTETLGAVEDGWLCDPDFHELPVPITISDLLATKPRLTTREEEEMFDAETYLPKAFKAASKEVQGYKSLYFWNSCRNSKDAADYFRSEGIEAMHIDGFFSRNKRIDILGSKKEGVAGWFNEAPKRVLCNCELLGVGYNQPDIELIGLGRVYKSLTAYLQAIGRGTRVVADVDSCLTRELRLDAIRISAKPSLRVVDMALQNKDHNLATPACLVTDDPSEIALIRSQKPAGRQFTIDEMRELVKKARASDGELSRIKLAEDLANAARKKYFKTPYVKHIIDNPRFKRGKPASSAALNYLRVAFDYSPPCELTAQQAYMITEAYKQHEQKALI